jgi:histidinol-phosphate aminotransferase
LEKTAVVLFQKGGEVISADPSYMSLMSVARAVGASWKAVPCKADWAHDLKAMEAAISSETKLIYICNPNNPTGAVTPGDALMDFCRRVSEKVPVFVDEAYMELAVGANTKSMISLVAEGHNVIVARTFSKIMGMAGLRIGYMAAQPEFLEKINQITRSGMGIAYTSVAAATAALADKEFQEMTLAKNQAAKVYLYEQLKKMQYDYIPSYANFVLFPIRIQGREMLEKMRSQQVMVRAFEIKGENWCRVSIGTIEEMRQFVQALESIS